MRGRWRHTIASVTVTVSCRAPTDRASAAACARSSAAPGTSNPAVKASTGSVVQPRHQRQDGGAVDAAGQEHAVGHVAALVQVHRSAQRRVQPGQRRLLADLLGRAGRQRSQRAARSTTWPSTTRSVSPGSTRWMPGKIVSAPVVNCICSSSSRAAGRTRALARPAASSACGSEAKASPSGIVAVVQRLDAERVARQRHAARRRGRGWRWRTCRAARRRSRRRSARHRCSGGSQSLPVASVMPGGRVRGSCRSRRWPPAPPARQNSGWSPVCRSMMASRVCTRAQRPTDVCPSPSGPRCASAAGQRPSVGGGGRRRPGAATAPLCRTCGLLHRPRKPRHCASTGASANSAR